MKKNTYTLEDFIRDFLNVDHPLVAQMTPRKQTKIARS